MTVTTVDAAAQAAIGAAARELHLPTVRAESHRLAEIAVRERRTHLGYLAEVLSAEVDDRSQRRRARRISEAKFPRLKRLSEFNVDAVDTIAPATLAHLATGTYMTAGEPIVLLGDSGTGKSHLLIGLGLAACEQGRSVRYTTTAQLVNELVEAADDRQLSRVVGRYGRLDLLCLDELGYVQIDPRGAELLFQIITEREERASIAIATNLPFSEWGTVFPDPAAQSPSSSGPARRDEGFCTARSARNRALDSSSANDSAVSSRPCVNGRGRTADPPASHLDTDRSLTPSRRPNSRTLSRIASRSARDSTPVHVATTSRAGTPHRPARAPPPGRRHQLDRGGRVVRQAQQPPADPEPLRDPHQQVVRHHPPATQDLRDLRLRLAGQRGDLPLRHPVLLQQPVHGRHVPHGERGPHVRPLPHRRVDRLVPLATDPAGGTVWAVERVRLDTHGSGLTFLIKARGAGVYAPVRAAYGRVLATPATGERATG